MWHITVFYKEVQCIQNIDLRDCCIMKQDQCDVDRRNIKSKFQCICFKVLVLWSIQNAGFWVVRPYSLVEGHQNLRGMRYLHLLGQSEADPKDLGSVFFRILFFWNMMLSHWVHTSRSLIWRHQVSWKHWKLITQWCSITCQKNGLLNLKTHAACYHWILTSAYKTAWCHNPEDPNLNFVFHGF